MKYEHEPFDFDLVILGGGAAGLLVIDRIIDDPWFGNWRILLIDKEEKQSDDRTWCYWEQGKGRYDHLLDSEWKEAVFKSIRGERVFDLAPYTYKMLRSAPFYNYVYPRVAKSSHVSFLRDKVLEVSDSGSGVHIRTTQKMLKARKCLSSVRDLGFLKDNAQYPLVQQHFLGWFVRSETPVFNENQVTLMDFSIDQKGNTRFMYILPRNPYEALLEYTLFSPDLLPVEAYENGIREYLDNMGLRDYMVIEKEQGNIPMTAYPFYKANSKNLMYIGTAGGWTKASTGYTFHNAMVRAGEVSAWLRSGRPLNTFYSRGRFEFYDRIFLNVLFSRNELGEDLFSRMFLKTDPVKILKFLDNRSTLPEELKIIRTMPVWLFLRNIFRPAV